MMLDIVRYLPRHATERFEIRSLSDIDRIIIHHEGDPNPDNPSTPWDIAHYHVDDLNRAGICYHSVVDRTGIRFKTNNDSTSPLHAGDQQNPTAIGICGLGNFDLEPPTREQVFGMVLEAIRYLDAYRDLEILGHSEVGNTSCPGKYLDLSDFRAALRLTRRRNGA